MLRSFPNLLVAAASLFLIGSFAQDSKSNRIIGNDQALGIYEEILSTRNPNAVIEILNKISIEQVKEDSLRAYFYYYKGSAFGQLSIFDSAIYYTEKAEADLPPEKHPIIEIQILRAFGNINWARNFYHIALKYYEDALNISNRVNEAEFQISLLGNIAGIYAKLENLPLALEYALKAEEISEKSGVIRPRSHMKIGTYYNDLGEFQKALTSMEKTKNLIHTEGRDSIALGVNYINMAQAQIELKQYAAAKKSIAVGKEILKRVGYEYASLYILSAKLSIAENNLSLASAQLKTAETIVSKQRDKDEIKRVKEIAKILAVKENRLEDAIKLQDEIYAINDSIKADKMVDRVYELQTQYESDRKNATINDMQQAARIQQLNLEQANRQLILLIGGTLVLVVLAFVLYRNYRLKAVANETLMELNNTKDKFFSIVAHDLKNPLSAFRSLSQSLHDNYHLMNSESILKTLNLMNDSATNLYAMLQNLLAWSMSEAGIIKAQKVVFDLRQLCDEVLTELKLEADLKKIVFENTIDKDFNVKADPKLMRIVLRNLVSNAIKFTPDGGSIKMQSESSDDFAFLKVSDTGVGISEQDLPKLFDLNSDANSIGSHANKGTGLGLVLSRELMEKQNGSIKAESLPGKGSTFTLQLSLN